MDMEPTPEQTAFMAKNWRDLIRPRTLEIEERSETYGKFSCEPLEGGFGTRPGGARRALRQVRVRAAGARLRHDPGRRAAAHPAVVAAGRGDHPHRDRGRAA